jgi:exodeoxyribonuclease V alpha subunit
MASPGRIDGELEFSDIDLHFAQFMSRLARCESQALRVAAALASRATANGDVCVRLPEYAGRTLPALEIQVPPLEEWLPVLRRLSVVGSPGDFRPLVLDDRARLYLYRYWDYERRLADNLLARAVDADDVNEKLLRKGLARFFPHPHELDQKLAAATAVLRRLCVISGGPGTGKTTTVVKILALIAEQKPHTPLSIGLAAPTGKAAARVQDAMRVVLEGLNLDLFTSAAMRLQARTLHRLLGARSDSLRYRHNRDNPLPLDVLVVDEASMADLALAASLMEALPSHARLILLGDKDQLASVEAGAVLGDICRSAGYSTRFAKRLASITGAATADIRTAGKSTPPLADSIALLQRSYRFGTESGIGTLARLVNEGRGADALTLLKDPARADIAWRSVAAADLRARVRASMLERLRAYFEAVRANEPADTIFERFNAFRLLCAHRRGRFGVSTFNALIEELVHEERLINARETWYPGRPIMISRNDYNLRLFNGDVGITLPDAADEGRLKVFFRADGLRARAVAPTRLPEHETVYAMTVHKSQGSEFAHVLLALPDELSPVMSRELVYTGITRAVSGVEVWGTETVFCEAVARRLVRASALQERLWGSE